MALVPGDMAPTFSAMTVGGEYGEGQIIDLESFRGRPVVLYFYPKDDTPGCTTQACALRDQWTKLRSSGTAIFGVSVDSPASHRKFIDKYGLPFALISDESREIVQAYGVWVEKSMYGKKYMGTERSTFVIDGDGRIKGIFRKVKPGEHADMLMKDLAHFEP